MRRLGRYCEGGIEAGWLAAVLLVPLFFNRSTSQVYEVSQANLLRAVAIAVLVAWAGKAFLGEARSPSGDQKQSLRSTLSSFFDTPLVLPVLFLLAGSLLSAAVSVVPRDSFFGFRPRQMGLYTLLSSAAIFAALVGNLRTRAQLERLLTAIVLPSVPISLYAIFQRLNLEPLAIIVRQTEAERVTSTLGQPVFLAAYLGMVLPIAGLRAIAAWRGDGQRARALAYSVVVTMQLGVIVLTLSRGPLLGVMAGLATAFGAVAAHRAWRRAALVVIGAGGIVLAALLILRIPSPDGGTSSGAGTPLVTRLKGTFETNTGSGLYRAVNWTIARNVFLNREPLEGADGQADRLALLRPWLGYGPETQWAVSPRSYVPDINTVAGGYFLTDRYHNELWDSLVTTGLVGVAGSLLLQFWAFWLALRALGLLASRRQTLALWAALVCGAAMGGLALAMSLGEVFIFLGLQAGAVLGLLVFLAARAVWGPPASSSLGESYGGLIVAALVALVTHLVEVCFSFTVAATGMLFWVELALLVLCCRVASSQQGWSAAAASKPSRSRPGPATHQWLVNAGLLAWVLICLGFDFLRPTQDRSVATILWEGLVGVSQLPATSWPVVAVIAAGALFGGGFLLHLDGEVGSRSKLPRLFTTAAVGAGLASGYWVFLATRLSRFGAPTTDALEALRRDIDLRQAVTTSGYVALLGAWCFTAVFLAPTEAGALRRRRFARVLAALAIGTLGLSAVIDTNLRGAWADGAVAAGDSYKRNGQLAWAAEAYRAALALAPEVDAYRVMLATSLLDQARATPEAETAERLFAEGAKLLNEALVLSPFNVNARSNLAVLYAAWVMRPADPGHRVPLVEKASRAFGAALKSNPQYADLWFRWALLQLRFANDPEGARESLNRAIAIVPSSPDPRALLGEYYSESAGRLEGASRREAFLAAAASYARALEVAPSRTLFYLAVGDSFLSAGEPERAIQVLRKAREIVPKSELKGVEELMARALEETQQAPR